MNFKNWFQIDEDAEKRVQSIIDGEGFVMFFKKEGDIYGASEDSRIIFAKMKNPDEELPKDWDDDASFSAHNMNKILRGEPSEHVFRKKDFKELKVVDKDDVVQELKKDVKEDDKGSFVSSFKVIDIRSLLQDPDKAFNFVRTDER